MSQSLPSLNYKDFLSTRRVVQDVLRVMSAWQRAFLLPDPHSWEHGLEVHMRGVVTKPCRVGNTVQSISMDIVRHKVRFGVQSWELHKSSGQEIFAWLSHWIQAEGLEATLMRPSFSKSEGNYSPTQLDRYAGALWWMNDQLHSIANQLNGGLKSPILLYPHHFDIALSWYPYNDERQLTIGFLPGDMHVKKPYIYLTAYPEPPALAFLDKPEAVLWQKEGFHGFVMPYSRLRMRADPETVLRSFAGMMQPIADLLR